MGIELKYAVLELQAQPIDPSASTRLRHFANVR